MSTPLSQDNLFFEGTRLVLPKGAAPLQVAKFLTDYDNAQNAKMALFHEVQHIPQAILAAIPLAAVQSCGGYLPISGKTVSVKVRTGPKRSDFTSGPYGPFKLPTLSTNGNVPNPHISTSLLNGNDPSKVGIIFQGEIVAKDRPIFDRFIATLEEILASSALYRGKALKWDLRAFRDPDHEYDILQDQPTFIDVSGFNPETMVFPEEIQKAIDLSLLFLIRQSDYCRRNKIPLKSGVLLAGPYGCGKSLLALGTALECVKNDWTFLQLGSVDDLPAAMKVARLFLSPDRDVHPKFTPPNGVVIFCEDLDQAMGTQDRTEEVNDILNTVDGIDYKDLPIICVFTTNHAERINKAMLRPGRIDTSILLSPPDGPTGLRLLSGYLGKTFSPATLSEDDLSEIKAGLHNLIPASIRQIAELAKRHMANRDDTIISKEDILAATQATRNHLRLMDLVPPDPSLNRELRIAETLGSAISRPIATLLQDSKTTLQESSSF